MITALDAGPHTFQSSDAELHYHVYGDGPVVIAVPGGPGFAWDYLRMPALEAHAKVIYFEPAGTGDSARLEPPSKYSRARDVADLENLRAHLGIDRVAVLGHSAGGFVAEQYAIEHTAHVESLVLYDSSPTDGPEFGASLDAEMKARSSHVWFPAAAAALSALFSRIVTDDEAKELGAKVWPLYFYDHDANPALTKSVESARFNPVRAQQGTAVPFDFRKQLSALHVRALIIVGARDFICAPRLSELAHAALAGSSLVVMQRSGHFAHIEEPAAFAATVAAFLRERPAR